MEDCHLTLIQVEHLLCCVLCTRLTVASRALQSAQQDVCMCDACFHCSALMGSGVKGAESAADLKVL